MISDLDVDLEMIRRGWAVPMAGGFVGDVLRVNIRPVYPPGVDRAHHEFEYRHRRSRVRAELEAQAGRDHAADMAATRWGSEPDALRAAVLQAMSESGRNWPSKSEAARRLRDRVNAILTTQGIAPRKERTIRRYIP